MGGPTIGLVQDELRPIGRGPFGTNLGASKVGAANCGRTQLWRAEGGLPTGGNTNFGVLRKPSHLWVKF